MVQFASGSLFASILGPAVSVQSFQSLGGMYSDYLADFNQFSEFHWKQDGANWANANFYDRAKIYYEWYAATGNETYLQRANALAVDYRTNYLEASSFGASAHWSQMGGVALHYAVTGDPKDLVQLGTVADYFAYPYYMDNLGKTGVADEMDNRMQARVLESFLYAWKTGAPSAVGNNWEQLLHTALDRILQSQSADGAYRFLQSHQLGYNKPYMVGMLNDALINYYEMFDKDPRILAAVKKSLDYMWQNNWDAATKGFEYIEGTVPNEGDATPTADLNNLIVNGFGWVYAMTGDATYKQRGDLVFDGSVDNAWLYGSKQFNQAYASSYKYIAYTHPELVSLWTDAPTPAPTAPAPAPSEPAPVEPAPAEPAPSRPAPEPDPIPAPPVSLELVGTSASETLSGGDGDDKIDGGAGNDVLNGGAGNDVLKGGVGNDKLFGGDGDDLLKYVVGQGADTFDGGAGADTLSVLGTAASDTLQLVFDGARITKVAGGAVANVESVTVDLVGAGNTLSYASSTAAVSVDLEAGAVSGLTSIQNVANVTGGYAADTLRGDAGNNVLDGGAGDDWLDGRGGNDTLRGGAGNDTLVGGAGRDTLDGGSGIDTASYAGETANFFVDLATGAARRGAPSSPIEDTLVRIENVVGGSGADTINGDAYDNRLDGGAGADVLFGGRGADVLVGGAGDDRMTGGPGNDTFVFRAGFGHDIIMDFTIGTSRAHDTIDLREFGFTSFSEIKAAIDSNGGWARIHAGADDITLVGVTEARLEASGHVFLF